MLLCSRCERERIYVQYLQSIIKKIRKSTGEENKRELQWENREDIYNVGEGYGIYNGNTVFVGWIPRMHRSLVSKLKVIHVKSFRFLLSRKQHLWNICKIHQLSCIQYKTIEADRYCPYGVLPRGSQEEHCDYAVNLKSLHLTWHLTWQK